ncbi:hypothetical protein [Sagittula salina]|uniref:LacI family transcriptional regulator n=1 Tax=Sagittula salina TaxID=2820268 RepID=A0A940S556_9RHOB|nr:hypothetical protein [Sagittula salina]MBP0484804.1 hypothetical protein [Sagittula salina]
MFDATRSALIDGTLSMVISHPMQAIAQETIATMIKARKAGPGGGAQRVAVSFELYTPENV